MHPQVELWQKNKIWWESIQIISSFIRHICKQHDRIYIWAKIKYCSTWHLKRNLRYVLDNNTKSAAWVSVQVESSYLTVINLVKSLILWLTREVSSLWTRFIHTHKRKYDTLNLTEKLLSKNTKYWEYWNRLSRSSLKISKIRCWNELIICNHANR